MVNSRVRLNTIMKTCPKCGAEHNKIGKFCSRACANSRSWTQSDKDTIRSGIFSSEKVKQLHTKMRVNQHEKNCPMCGSSFRLPKSLSENRIYCSRKCYLNDKDCKYRTASIGGYREGSGRAKTGYYKGVYCGSTYELVWVIYQIDHKKEFSRFDSFLEFEGKKYYPDFIQNGIIVEIKGYESKESVEVKNNIARKNGYEIIVLRKEDLQKEFEWVREKYTSDFKMLYDEYRPRYTYTCLHCSMEFGKDKKSKYEKVFCSRACSLKKNRKVSGKNQYTKHRDAASVATSPSN